MGNFFTKLNNLISDNILLSYSYSVQNSCLEIKINLNYYSEYNSVYHKFYNKIKNKSTKEIFILFLEAFNKEITNPGFLLTSIIFNNHKAEIYRYQTYTRYLIDNTYPHVISIP